MTNLAILRETISAVEREKGVNIETDIRDFGQISSTLPLSQQGPIESNTLGVEAHLI